MSDNDNYQEKTEEPTPKRRESAKQKGQIARSRELNTMVVVLSASIGIYLFGESMVENILVQMNENFSLSRADIFDDTALVSYTITNFKNGLKSLIPLFIVLIFASIVASVSLGGWTLNLSSLMPKLERISLPKGLKRMVSIKALMELSKALAKFIVIALMAVIYIKWRAVELLYLGSVSVQFGISQSILVVLIGFIFISTTLIIISMVDVPFQLWEHSKKLRMSHQEIKDEHKESEGKPEVKRKIKQLQIEMAKRRMMDKVPNADVVITNPTHFAVALSYQSDIANAPIVVAKGGDLVAEKIKEIAVKHKVAVVCTPPLARALYYTTPIGKQIPEGLYVAVAKILAYVYQLKNTRQYHDPEKIMMEDLPIPDEFKH